MAPDVRSHVSRFLAGSRSNGLAVLVSLVCFSPTTGDVLQVQAAGSFRSVDAHRHVEMRGQLPTSLDVHKRQVSNGIRPHSEDVGSPPPQQKGFENPVQTEPAYVQQGSLAEQALIRRSTHSARHGHDQAPQMSAVAAPPPSSGEAGHIRTTDLVQKSPSLAVESVDRNGEKMHLKIFVLVAGGFPFLLVFIWIAYCRVREYTSHGEGSALGAEPAERTYRRMKKESPASPPAAASSGAAATDAASSGAAATDAAATTSNVVLSTEAEAGPQSPDAAESAPELSF